RLVPPEVVLVSESGVRGPDDVRRLRDLGVRAVLVGTALSKSEDPDSLVRALVAAGKGEAV
ncbi:indole-3-glycerol-phosphate synthase TrpC, partial [bacterium]|nr:indole-3-glycerol-phosphate synthase TrpC [bacterium]